MVIVFGNGENTITLNVEQLDKDPRLLSSLSLFIFNNADNGTATGDLAEMKKFGSDLMGRAEWLARRWSHTIDRQNELAANKQ
jgi:hypothetical protein